MSVNQYDTTEKAGNYQQFASTNVYHTKVYTPSVAKFFNHSLVDKRVVDLACGSGDSTLCLANLKPRELVGVDLSQDLIDLANKFAENNSEYANIKYLVRDCAAPLGLGHFDVVFSIHFLNYADTQQKLVDMIASMFEATKPGGLCAGIMVSPFMKKESYPALYKYGVKYERGSDDRLEVSVKLYDGSVDENRMLIQFFNYLWPPHLYEKSFKEAGFVNFEWQDLHLGKEESESTREFFVDYLTIQPHRLFKAERPLN